MKTMPPAGAFIGHTIAALFSGSFVGLLLSVPTDNTRPVLRIAGRPVVIRREPMLSLTLREARRDTARNLKLEEVSAWLTVQLAGEFRSAYLETTEGNWQFTINSKGRAILIAHKSAATSAPLKSHDRRKASLLDESALPWLIALGLCDGSGRVRPSAADKHRQLERFLEIFHHLARDCGWMPGCQIRIADMGCGKGYLTFGVWQLLNRTMRLNAEIVGVESREDLVTRTNAVARSIGAENLTFVPGNIATAKLDRLDGLIALHACNTATDEAMARGVREGAKLIVVSPCCHQELRPQLGRPPLLAPLLAQGILAERFSEWLTDGLRALRLEQAGYGVKVIEFVASEHTPRNLLITGIREKTAAGSKRSGDKSRALKEFFQIGPLASDEIASH